MKSRKLLQFATYLLLGYLLYTAGWPGIIWIILIGFVTWIVFEIFFRIRFK